MNDYDRAEQELLIKLVISLNQGNSGYATERVDRAMTQLEQLKEKGVIFNYEDN